MKTETTAVAAANSNTAVGAVSGKLQLALEEYNGFFDVATVTSLSMAAPRIKAEQGACFKGDEELGPSITLEVVSFNPRWMIVTGEDANDAESKEALRISFDDKYTLEGEDVADYIESLKAQGYEKAKKAPYIDLYGFITKIGNKEVPLEERELCAIQLSKTSAGNFQAFCVTQGFYQQKGLAKPSNLVQVNAVRRTSGNNKYTNFTFSAAK